MENVKESDKLLYSNVKGADKEQNSTEILSENAKKLVSLIVRIIVNSTIKQCYEEGDQVSEI